MYNQKHEQTADNLFTTRKFYGFSYSRGNTLWYGIQV